jgi:hypothetical protein
MRWEGEKTVAVSCIPRANRCPEGEELCDAGKVAVGPRNEEGWRGGAEKRATSGRVHQPHRSDGMMGRG